MKVESGVVTTFMRNMTEDIKNWVALIEKSRIAKKNKALLVEYVTRLVESGFPIIWGLEHLGNITGIKKKVLARMVNNQEKFYRYFSIPKRRGGIREIASPYPSLLEVQYWILINILKNMEASQFAHGFLVGRSIVTNASLHLGSNHFLKMDLKDFFPSIRINRVISVFKHAGYKHNVALSFAQLCTLNGYLPQGAPTSPQLSNIIAKRLDYRLAGLAKCWNLTYTRYADDLAFSGNYISQSFISAVNAIIIDERFNVNEDKTRLVRGKGKKIVTGISVSSDTLKLPKKTRRELRQEVHYLTVNGFSEHTRARGILDPMYVERLLGRLSFWMQIEPNNEFVLNSLKKVRVVQQQLDSI